VVRTTIFIDNETQTVRLPKEVALPDNVHAIEITATSRLLKIASSSGD
jgi:virulence-associated protein VagC